MKIGIIDIGSNTIKAFVYNIINKSIEVTAHKQYGSQLMNYVKNNKMTDEGIMRAAYDCAQLKLFLNEQNCQNIYAIATDAIRSSSNCDDILYEIYLKTSLDVEIIEGEKEAYYDAVSLMHFSKTTSGCGVDLGGGSMQFVKYENLKITAAVSMPLGVLRLTNTFAVDYLPTENQEQDLSEFIKIKISGLSANASNLFIMGGTSHVIRKISSNPEFSLLKNGRLSVDELRYVYKQISQKGAKLKDFLTKYANGRERTILSGIFLIMTVLEYLECSSLEFVDGGVREGFLLDKLK